MTCPAELEVKSPLTVVSVVPAGTPVVDALGNGLLVPDEVVAVAVI